MSIHEPNLNQNADSYVVLIRRLAGLAVLVLTLLPIYRLIRTDQSGPWGESTVAEATRSFDIVLWGSVLIAGVAIVAGIWARQRARGDTPPEGEGPPHTTAAVWLGRLADLPVVPFAVACGALSTALSAIVARRVFLRLFTNVDEMTSVIHARYLAAGMAGGPVGDAAEAWLVPNMLVTDVGWVSQYPPGHLLLLALAERIGLVWLLGPLLAGAMVTFSCLAVGRLLPDRAIEVRLGGLLMALSPFVLLLGGGALSHLSAGAAVSAAAYFGMRALEGRMLWAVAAGAATGIAVISRPWTGITLATALVLAPWIWQFFEDRRSRELMTRVALWVAGGIPFAVLVASYNAHIFGDPLQLGYQILYGPAHKLGFHLDPWGYPYGLREAVAYTSADLIRFGAALLDTPIPLTLVAGGVLLLSPTLPRGAGTLAVWALVPVAANALYWFHQPRMLFESAPGWIWLGVIGIGLGVRASTPAVRAATLSAVLLSLVVGLWAFVPVRFSGNSWSEETLSRLIPPVAEDSDQQAIVFVHASWNERVAGRLQAAGMRNDSLQALIRRNDMCALDRYARSRRGQDLDETAAALDSTVDFTQTADLRAGLSPVATPGGVRVPRLPSQAWTPNCIRELNADRFGAVALAPLLWQGALPGLKIEAEPRARRLMFVRDFGPVANRSLLERFAERVPWVFTPTAPDGAPEMLPYREGMELLWGASPE